MKEEQLLQQIIHLAGGKANISRSNYASGVLELFVKDCSLVKIEEIREVMGVADVFMRRSRIRIEIKLITDIKERITMSQYTEMATRLIDLVGGKDNVTEVLHCMTRLRFRLKDEKLLNAEEIKKVEGVLGFQKNVGEYQIIIGAKVDDVYQEVVRIGEFLEKRAIQENLDTPAVKERVSFKKIGSKLFELISGCITPVIPAFVIMGMLNTIAALLGPSVLNVLSAQSNVYILLTGMASAVTYFLPFLLAYSASRKLGANTIVSLVMAALLMSPVITGAVTAGKSFTVFGIPMMLINYSTTFLPIILIVAVQVYIEKFLNKIIPNVLKAMLVPTLTVLIMAPIGLCALGPIGNWLGTGLASVLMALSEHAGFLEGALVAGLYPFLVAFGMGGPIFLATFTVYTQTGLDYLYFPFMAVYGMCIEGVAIAYIIKSKSANAKQVGIVALTSQALGAVSEPTIYGILFKNKVCLAVTVVSSAIGGFYIGLTHIAMVNLTVSIPVIGPFLMFSGSTTSNMVNGCIGVVAAFILGFVGTLIFYKGKED
ncbi:PTS transporter subunit EIIC [Anaerocolumna xylanovorans]|uniref:PTS system IIB component, Glc family /PTS system IIC component, Glc family n=1 Tax=Anaerocolumna xylanovorans DSM 12503 TaxID=1121345 RepID=A0A1M7Y0Q8_9FIRM|nr:PTS transporter subunit EIIC [Anaerocolumna xylanovorans]SHO45261.1 PTS system IIB component, Glc family /PTS system IIC component, Glc family [Anaerocolumna xylanovorans DSM 12503]